MGIALFDLNNLARAHTRRKQMAVAWKHDKAVSSATQEESEGDYRIWLSTPFWLHQQYQGSHLLVRETFIQSERRYFHNWKWAWKANVFGQSNVMCLCALLVYDTTMRTGSLDIWIQLKFGCCLVLGEEEHGFSRIREEPKHGVASKTRVEKSPS